jgi:predicted ribosome quality control (RQC) complex YloA/Tae2 family protein
VLPETPAAQGETAARPRARTERPDVAGFDPETIPEGLASEEEARVFLRGAVRALPPEWAAEVLARARFGETPAPERRGMLSAAWRELAAEFASSERAYLYRTEKRSVLSPVRLRSLPEPPREFAGFIEAAAVWWKESDEAVRRNDALSVVRSAAAKERKRLLRLLEKQKAELEGASRAPLYRKQAEILGIHFRDVAKGAASVRLPDPYDGGEIEIRLDPAISARRNIERLFQLAKRGERGAAVVGGRIAETERLLASTEATLDAAEHATTADEAELLAAKAAPALRKKDSRPAWREKIKKPKDRDEKLRPREYRIAGGYTVLVGRDNKENDRLTLHIARPGDIWFHAGQAAGSHVVLLRDDPRKPVPGEALLEAAAIAAWYSKAKHGAKVPVVYTERRHVRKPRGWPPGKVTCAREKTLFVDPRVPDGGAA